MLYNVLQKENIVVDLFSEINGIIIKLLTVMYVEGFSFQFKLVSFSLLYNSIFDITWFRQILKELI